LYYTQTKAVLPREEIRRRAGFFFGHLGYITGMGEYVMTDMLWMRIWASFGCTCIVGYQLVQPKWQWPGIVWNSVYIFVNLFQIYLLKKAPPVFQDDEADLWEAVRPHFAPNQMITLLNLGEFRSFEHNSKLFEQSQRSLDDEVYILTAGSCEVRVDGIPSQQLSPGSVMGEVDMLSGGQDVTSTATVVAVGDDVKCFCLSCTELKERMGTDSKLNGAVQSMFAESVLQKVLALNAKCDVVQYAAVLDLSCKLGEPIAMNAALEEHEHVRAEVLKFSAESRQSQESTELEALTSSSRLARRLEKRNSEANFT
jgi:hypothetical protein